MEATTELYTFTITADGNTTYNYGNSTSQLKSYVFELNWVDYSEIGILLFMFIFGAPGNGLIVFVQWKSTDTTSTDCLVAGMAVCDFLDSSVITALALLNAGFRHYVASPWFCKLLNFFLYWAAMASVFNIGALAIDRYILICWPFSRIYTKRIAKLVSVLVAVVSGILASPALFFLSYNSAFVMCVLEDGVQVLVGKWNAVLVTSVIIILVLTIVAYFRIACELRKIAKRSTIARGLTVNIGAKNELKKTAIRIASMQTPRSSKKVELNEEQSSLKQVPADFSAARRINKPDAENITEARQPSPKPVMVCSTSSPHSAIGTNFQKVQTRDPKRFRQLDIDRMTIALFSITVIYIISWGTPSTLFITNYNTHPAFKRLLYLFGRSNIVTNPLVFILLSSKFRANAKKVLCRNHKYMP